MMDEISKEVNFISELKSKESYLINPILRHYSILQKSQSQVVYPDNRPEVITKRTNTYPIYLADLGRLIALDITSQNLDSEFYDRTTDFAGMESEETVLISKLYNFDAETARAVSWGEITSHDIGQELYQLYHTNMLNDLFTTPSILTDRGYYSPTRWFRIESSRPNAPSFEANFNYNIGLIHLDEQSVENAEEVSVWINDEITLYELPAYCLMIDHDGYVHSRSLILHYPNNPEQLKDRVAGGIYFICSMMSFNEYTTSYSRTPYDSKFNIHIIESLREFSYNAYDLARLMFLNHVNSIDTSSYLFQWKLKKKSINDALQFMIQFDDNTEQGLIGFYGSEISSRNPLIRIQEVDHHYIVTMVNPGVVPHLLFRKLRFSQARGDPKKILNSDDIIQEVGERESTDSDVMDVVRNPEFTRIHKILKPRSQQIEQLSELFDHVCFRLR